MRTATDERAVSAGPDRLPLSAVSTVVGLVAASAVAVLSFRDVVAFTLLGPATVAAYGLTSWRCRTSSHPGACGSTLFVDVTMAAFDPVGGAALIALLPVPHPTSRLAWVDRRRLHLQAAAVVAAAGLAVRLLPWPVRPLAVLPFVLLSRRLPWWPPVPVDADTAVSYRTSARWWVAATAVLSPAAVWLLRSRTSAGGPHQTGVFVALAVSGTALAFWVVQVVQVQRSWRRRQRRVTDGLGALHQDARRYSQAVLDRQVRPLVAAARQAQRQGDITTAARKARAARDAAERLQRLLRPPDPDLPLHDQLAQLAWAHPNLTAVASDDLDVDPDVRLLVTRLLTALAVEVGPGRVDVAVHRDGRSVVVSAELSSWPDHPSVDALMQVLSTRAEQVSVDRGPPALAVWQLPG